MTQYEMTEALSEKMHVTIEEAKAALEAGNWNVLTATHQLEQENFRQKQALNAFAEGGMATAVQEAPEEAAAEEPATDTQAAASEATETVKSKKRARGSGARNLGHHIRRVIACGNRNRFVVRKDDEVAIALPVTVLVLLLLFAFWVCVPLLVIGLFAGFRYSFSGRELGREGVNNVLAKASDAADHVKKAVAQA